MRTLRVLAAFALASTGWAVDWAKDVTAHFVEPHTREHVQKLAGDKKLPAMVIVMTSWCAACSGLRDTVNQGTKVKALLDKFVVAYAPEEGEKQLWTEAGQNYVPQVYFYNAAGAQLHVYANTNYKYFFADETHLEQAMQSALKLVAEGSVGTQMGHAGTQEQATTAPPHDAAHRAVSASPEPEVKTKMFDPSHAFDESISGHFQHNLKPEEMRAKATEANRPFMVLLTQEWCDACVKLTGSVNEGKHTKDLLSAFVVNNAFGTDGLQNWQPQGENYVPQALFFDVDGQLLEVNSKYPQYKHFFSSDEELGEAMAKALDMSKTVGEL